MSASTWLRCFKPGQNLITATVWNFGIYAPIAQMSDRTAFLLESEATGADSISTPEGWLVEDGAGQRPLDRSPSRLQDLLRLRPRRGNRRRPLRLELELPSRPGSAWVPAASPMRDSIFGDVNKAHSADTTGDNPWGLVPDALPHMEYSPTSAGQIDRVDSPGTEQPRNEPHSPTVRGHRCLPASTSTFSSTARPSPPPIPSSPSPAAKAHTSASPTPKPSTTRTSTKATATSRTTARALGLTDSFLPDGGAHRTFEPLWWRTWRYLDLDITTGDRAAHPRIAHRQLHRLSL